MASRVNLPGVRIKKFSSVLNKETGRVETTIQLRTEWTKKIMQRMRWQEFPSWTENPLKLRGELIAKSLKITPVSKALANEAIEFKIHSAANFKAYRITEQNSTHVELDFEIKTAADDVEALCGAYLRRIGEAPSTMMIEYERQMELGEPEEASDDNDD